MADCLNYNCDPIGDHAILDACKKGIKGGAKDIIFFSCGYTTTDFTNGTQIQSDIDGNLAKLIQNVTFSFGKPSDQTVDSLVACSPQISVNKEWSGAIVDGNVMADNDDFWDSLMCGPTIGAMLVLNCGEEGETATLIDAEISFSGGKVFPATNKEFQRYEIDLKWVSCYNPRTISAPANVWN